MFLDARRVGAGETIETDVCIVGAGAAGITLAREFMGRPFRVAILESGGEQFDPQTQALYQGEICGTPYYPLDAARLGYFGGTTNHWGGMCWPLEAIDFESRAWVPYSGWPFGRTALEPYYRRAQQICNLGPFDYDAGSWEDADTRPRLDFQKGWIRTQIAQFSRPARFSQAYRGELARAPNLQTYLNASVVDIGLTPNGRTVDHVSVACLEGQRFRVRSRWFILAAGGIENPRLLLISNRVQSQGIGNQHDLVGRFFMEHPSLYAGLLLLSNPYLNGDLYDHNTVRGTRIQGALTLSEEVQREKQILNYCCVLQAVPDETLSASEAVTSSMELYAALRERRIPGGLLTHLHNILVDLDDVGRALYTRMAEGTLVKLTAFKIFNHPEQCPNPDSRVSLSPDRDALGRNRVRLDWRLTEVDKRTMRVAQEVLAREAGLAGLGRVQMGLDEDDAAWTRLPREAASGEGPFGSFHHMGTTRMHENEKLGVVDPHCRVHDVSNLFVAGSSVFPTVGYANPTLTLVALAVRLADHLKARLAGAVT